jgi:hypothetical protein
VVQSPITDDSNDEFDFFDIPMNGIEGLNELDEYLLQALEKTRELHGDQSVDLYSRDSQQWLLTI